ncbi:DM13 domain-containing protein [Stenomitos frigidus]|uniref:Electron transfer flavoprotein n=1 Tax=Stenomitos frigidus ULC18 TaxID=2107698 RepID=A0A2T1EIA3_9CYAN|nr:DM13 domain-containing protein [Stenomitos frigidus]PSB32486.1 electron transfer flavoprotein [Stenomitos frigidus ULC18]
MNVKRWILLSLASLVFIGYVGRTIKNQAAESPLPSATSAAAQSITSELIAQAMNSTKPTTIKSGSFASGEQSTQGTARIIAQDGKLFLELGEGFKTSNKGPDLVVILHRSSNVLGATKPPAYPLQAGDYLLLAPLRKFSGTQRYAIPATVNVAEYQSAAIWCRKFNATFGAAKLVSSR